MFQGFSTKPVETSHVCKCWVGLEWALEKHSAREGGPTPRFQGGVKCFFFCPPKLRCCKFSHTYFSLLWPSINKVFHVDIHVQRCLVAKKPGGGGKSETPRRCGSNLEFANIASIYASSIPSRALCVTCTCHTDVYREDR